MDRSLLRLMISTSPARSPMASRSIASTSGPVSPGSVRMSTSKSTRSGMTLTLVPPRTTVGAKVVCVHACACRASPIIGSASHISTKPSAVRNGVLRSDGKSMPSTKRRHVSWIRVSGR